MIRIAPGVSVAQSYARLSSFAQNPDDLLCRFSLPWPKRGHPGAKPGTLPSPNRYSPQLHVQIIDVSTHRMDRIAL